MTTGVVDKHAVEPGVGHGLRFANRGAAQAGGARVELPPADAPRLVRLDMRPQLSSGATTASAMVAMLASNASRSMSSAGVGSRAAIGRADQSFVRTERHCMPLQSLSPHPLTAPSVMPRTRYRWNAATAKKTGSVPSTDIAEIFAQNVDCAPKYWLTCTG